MPRNDSNSVHNHVSWSCGVSGEHCCLLVKVFSIPGAQHGSACMQDRLDENTNMVRTQTLTNSEVDKGFPFISASNSFGKYLLELKHCLRSFSHFPLAGVNRQTWSCFKQPTRAMIRALVHSVSKLNYPDSPVQNNADWNWHLSARTSCQAERAWFKFSFIKIYISTTFVTSNCWHQQ